MPNSSMLNKYHTKYSFALIALLILTTVIIFSGCIKQESLDPTKYISKRTIDTEVSALEDYQNLNK